MSIEDRRVIVACEHDVDHHHEICTVLDDEGTEHRRHHDEHPDSPRWMPLAWGYNACWLEWCNPTVTTVAGLLAMLAEEGASQTAPDVPS